MMVVSLGIILALSLATPISVDSASTRGHGSSRSWLPLTVISSLPASIDAAQDPAPQEPKPAPEEEKKPQPQDAAVEGHVKLRDGRPAAGARIVAKGPEGAVANAIADGNGTFRLAGLEGPYSLEISAGGKVRLFKVQIKGGRLTPADFTVE